MAHAATVFCARYTARFPLLSSASFAALLCVGTLHRALHDGRPVSAVSFPAAQHQHLARLFLDRGCLVAHDSPPSLAISCRPRRCSYFQRAFCSRTRGVASRRAWSFLAPCRSRRSVGSFAPLDFTTRMNTYLNTDYLSEQLAGFAKQLRHRSTKARGRGERRIKSSWPDRTA